MIWQVHPKDGKNPQTTTPNTAENTNWGVPTIERGDSMKTFKVKARLFTTALKSNLSQDDVHYTKNLKASIQTFLQADQSWIMFYRSNAVVLLAPLFKSMSRVTD